jgi:hypothetical protein
VSNNSKIISAGQAAEGQYFTRIHGKNCLCRFLLKVTPLPEFDHGASPNRKKNEGLYTR